MKTFCRYSLVLFMAVAVISIFGRIAAEGQNDAAASKSAAKAPAGNAADGKRNFVDYGCYECHGYMAQGGGAGPRIAPDPWPFAEFSQFVRNPKGEMPPFAEKLLPDKEVADIYAFLQSLPHPADAKSMPLLK